MRTLFLDLGSHSDRPNEGACMACVSDQKVESIVFIDHRIGDEGLMPVFDEVLNNAKWAERDLTNIACVTGPGGFTSLRMAVALANTLADQLQIPACAIHLSDLYAARIKLQETRNKKQIETNNQELITNNFFWIHATKKDALFIKGFGSYTDQWREPTLVPLAELAEKLPAEAPVAGEVLPAQREVLKNGIVDIELDSLQNVLPEFLLKQQYHNEILAPWYGRGW